MSHELISLKEAAKRLGVSVGSLRAWIRDGQVPAYRLGQRFTRVSWEEVLGALSSHAGTTREPEA